MTSSVLANVARANVVLAHLMFANVVLGKVVFLFGKLGGSFGNRRDPARGTGRPHLEQIHRHEEKARGTTEWEEK